MGCSAGMARVGVAIGGVTDADGEGRDGVPSVAGLLAEALDDGGGAALGLPAVTLGEVEGA